MPALAGQDFLGKWTGATANELFERIRTTMPQASPGSLSPQQYVDIVAHIFRPQQISCRTRRHSTLTPPR